ncbi:MAG TPA: hypothetical protein VNZ52_14585 [Candidatus Thermoplasmatota archaeon]|nr:hypothetical protein [Candidatus Thermoplasmatota archaeon]
MGSVRLLILLGVLVGVGGGLVYLGLTFAPLQPIESPCPYFVVSAENREQETRNLTIHAPSTWSYPLRDLRIRLDLNEKQENLPLLTDAARPEGVDGLHYIDVAGAPDALNAGDVLHLNKEALEAVQSNQYPLLINGAGMAVVLGPSGGCA